MKNKVIVLVVSIVFVGILVLASVIVNKYSNDMALDTGVSGDNMENNNEEEEKMSISACEWMPPLPCPRIMRAI